MTMTTDPATGPMLRCPRCDHTVEAVAEVHGGVTVLSVAEHECVFEPRPPANLPVVPVEPGTHVEPAVKSAIDAAVEGALAMPGVPGRDEFLTLAAQARMLSLSGGAPKLLREDPYLAFHVVLIGRDLGISPSAAVELIDVIPGSGQRGPQLSLSPQLLNGQIRRLGLGSIVKAVSDEFHCVAVALEPGGRLDWRCKRTWPEHVEGCGCRGLMGDVEFTWQDAQRAGIAGPDCMPGAHKTSNPGKGAGGCGCNQGYVTYPQRMHWWRASGYTADDYFPEAGLGLYTAEELGAIVDEDGRPIDVTSVELPPGYEVAAPPPPEPVDYTLVTNLQVAILALPDQQRAELKERWQQTDKLKGKGAWRLDAGEVRLATSLVKGFEAAARRDSKGEWNQDQAQMATMATVSHVVGALLAYPVGLPAGSSEAPHDGPGAPEPGGGGESPADAPADATGPPEPPLGTLPEPGPADGPSDADIADATEAEVDAAIEAVRALTQVRDVDKELTNRRLRSDGEAKDRRNRLARAMVAEAIANRGSSEQDA